jgi:hypothetical protein
MSPLYILLPEYATSQKQSCYVLKYRQWLLFTVTSWNRNLLEKLSVATLPQPTTLPRAPAKNMCRRKRAARPSGQIRKNRDKKALRNHSLILNVASNGDKHAPRQAGKSSRWRRRVLNRWKEHFEEHLNSNVIRN